MSAGGVAKLSVPLPLVRYDAACRALTAAKHVDEVKDIRDKAEAIRAYARMAKNRELEIDAAEIRGRAERRLGEVMADQPKSVGGRPSETGSICDPVLSLAKVGIDKHLARSSAQTQRHSARGI
jgi:hypothetical protein